MSSAPLVSCIMPTHDRRAYVPAAIALFLRQTYVNRELVILDDGRPVADLVPDDPRIHYVPLASYVRLGLKRNLACAKARGDILVHWDDDDWYPDWRIEAQVAQLSSPKLALVGSSAGFFYEGGAAVAWRYQYRGPGHFLLGSTLAYKRALWEAHPFADVTVGEDTKFVHSVAGDAIGDLADPRLCVASIHPRNTSRRYTVGAFWHAIPLDDLPPGALDEIPLVPADAGPPGPVTSPGSAGWERRPTSSALVRFGRDESHDPASGNLAPARAVASARPVTSPLLGEYLRQTALCIAPLRLPTPRCIVTLASASFAPYLDRLLGSLRTRGVSAGTSLVTLVPEGDTEAAGVAERHGSLTIPFRPTTPGPTMKGLLYSITRMLEADEYICMDADMMVVDALDPLFERLSAVHPRSVLACRDARLATTLGEAMDLLIGHSRADLAELGAADVAGYPLVVNDGLFCARRGALVALDAEIRRMSGASAWVGGGGGARRRTEIVFNAAIAKLDCGVVLDRRYNVQLGKQTVTRRTTGGRDEVLLHGCHVAVVHFDGRSRLTAGAWDAPSRSAVHPQALASSR